MKIVERIRYGSRGQGSLIKYAGVAMWMSCYYLRGVEHRESTKHADLKKARAWHRQKLEQIASERQGHAPVVTPSMKQVTVNALLDELAGSPEFTALKSAASCMSHAAAIRAHFGTWRAVHVTAEAWDRYIDQRRTAGRAAATINRERAVLRAALTLAVERKRLTAMQVPRLSRLPERNVRRVFFDRDEFEAVVAHLPEYLQDAARFAFLTGWRKGDVRSLTWADVDARAMTITLPTSKNDEGRTLALPEELIAIVQRREAARLVTTPAGDVRIVEHVFHCDGRRLGDFRKAWHTACRQAGLVHLEKDADGNTVEKHDKVWHDFRRSGVRNLRRAGVDETVAMKITGHKTASVFRRYNIVDERDLREAMQATTAYVKTLPTSREVGAPSAN
jgi:integrase